MFRECTVAQGNTNATIRRSSGNSDSLSPPRARGGNKLIVSPSRPLPRAAAFGARAHGAAVDYEGGHVALAFDR